jgi:3-oxoadipate enol-lactonase
VNAEPAAGAERTAGAVALHHTVDGPAGAPPLVLGGSLGTTLEMWRPQLEALAGHHRVVRFDHRGHGRSPVPPGPYRIEQLGRDVLRLLDTLRLRRVNYAGLSLGGMVGMWLAAHAPDRLCRLVLLCTAAHLPPELGYRQRAAQVRTAGMAGIVDAVLNRWFTPDFPAPAREPFRAMLAATPPEGYAGCCEAIAAMDLRPVLSKITAPTLVVAGAGDPAIPPRYAERIAGAIPGSRLVVLDHAAHLANVEQADAVSRLLEAWFGDEKGGSA